MPSHYTKITLAQRPTGLIDDNTFKIESTPYDFNVGQKEALIKVLYVTLDPAMRGWLNDARSYVPPVGIGEIMRALGLAVVVQAGEGSKFKVGQTVRGAVGWTEYAVMKDAALELIEVPQGAELLDFLNTLGASGMTAYFGFKDILDVKPGETVVVSGAAGSVGMIACSLAKRAGAKTYAIAGSPEKCDWLEKEIGVDRAFNYKSPSFRTDFKDIGYIHAYFDNVGGDILDLVLTRLQIGARIALCGAIADYNTAKPKGLQNYRTLISQRAKIQGFIVFDYADKYHIAEKELAEGLADGSIKRKFHIIEGLEKAPVSVNLLFSGGNTGKLIVKVANEKAKI